MHIKEISGKNNSNRKYTVEYRIILFRLKIDDFIPLGTGYEYNNNKLIENN